MAELCDFQIHVNGQHTFFVNQETMSKFSGKLRKIVNQEKRRTQIRNSRIDIVDFPGGPDGFELVSRLCHNNGKITITVSNVSVLHCSALFLEMTEKVSPDSCNNLLQKTEEFLEGMFYWSWNDIITCLKSSESFFQYAESCPSDFVPKLMNSLSSKISQNSHVNSIIASSSSTSSSSPDTPSSSGTFRSSSKKKTWWFHDLTVLPPKIIENFIKTLVGYGIDNNNNNNNNNNKLPVILTRFLLHYLKSAAVNGKKDYQGYFGKIADTAVQGVISMGKSSFSCRGLFSVLRVVASSGVSRESRGGLERMIGGALDEATLDDLLVSCGHDGGSLVFDVNLVLRLIRVFVCENVLEKMKMKKVGRLIDDYMVEIAPDHSLKASKFLGVAESLPDFARHCFGGVYRAIDIYFQSHPRLSEEERSRLCRCLNYKKLSLEACKDLAKNPRIPPRVAVQALAAQHPYVIGTHLPTTTTKTEDHNFDEITEDMTTHCDQGTTKIGKISTSTQMVVYRSEEGVIERRRRRSCSPEAEAEAEAEAEENGEEEEEDVMRLNLKRMQWRVVELERECREMKGKMSKMMMVKTTAPSVAHYNSRALPRLC